VAFEADVKVGGIEGRGKQLNKKWQQTLAALSKKTPPSAAAKTVALK